MSTLVDLDQIKTILRTVNTHIPTILDLVHTKSGTIHHLTFHASLPSQLDGVGFFTATADYTAGDIIHINGTAFTVKTMNGSTPPTGMFKSGTTVVVGLNYQSKSITFKVGNRVGGVDAEKLSLATASVGDVLSGKTFYSGNNSLKTGTRGSGTIQLKYDYVDMLANSTLTVPLDFKLGYYFIWAKQKTNYGPRSKFCIDGRVGLVDTAGYEGHGGVVSISTSTYSVTFKTDASSIELEYYLFGSP